MTKNKKILTIVLAVVLVAVITFSCFLFFKIIPDIQKQKELEKQVKE